MKRLLLALAVSGCFLGVARAGSLIVTKASKGIAAEDVRTDGDTVLYKDNTTGAENSLPAADVDGIIPFVEKGRDYETAEIKAALDLIKKLKPKHVGLTKYFSQLEAQWDILQKGVDMASELDKLVGGFSAGDKSTKAFKSVTMSIELLGLKDPSAKYTAQIAGALATVKKAYLADLMAKLADASAAKRIAIEKFRAILEMAHDVSSVGDAQQKKKAETLVAQARKTTFETTLRDAMAFCAGQADIDAYLRSRDLLYRLREEIADTEDRRKWVAVGLSRQIDFMSKAMPAYCFGGGFPMSKEDQEAFGDPQMLSGNLKITATSEAPEALIFPAKAPESLRMRTPFSLPVTLIFNRAQPPDRRYAIILTVNGTGAAFNHILEQKKLEIKEGRAQVTVNEDFLTLPPRFTPAVDSEGNVRLYASVAWRRSREGVGDEWVPISFACSITLSGP